MSDGSVFGVLQLANSKSKKIKGSLINIAQLVTCTFLELMLRVHSALGRADMLHNSLVDVQKLVGGDLFQLDQETFANEELLLK